MTMFSYYENFRYKINKFFLKNSPIYFKNINRNYLLKFINDLKIGEY